MDDDTKSTMIGVCILIVAMVFLIVVAMNVSKSPVFSTCTTKENLGIIKTIEIVTRSWNAADKLVLTMEKPNPYTEVQWVIDYDGLNYHTGETLYKVCTKYVIEETK